MLALTFPAAPEIGHTAREPDLALDPEQPRLAEDSGLRTAVLLSLFSDARAEPGDELPDGVSRGGYWGDAYPARPGDRWGSRLWLLSRSTITREVLRRAETYAREALAWAVEDGIASRVTATAAPRSAQAFVLEVVLYRGAEDLPVYRDRWEVETDAL